MQVLRAVYDHEVQLRRQLADASTMNGVLAAKLAPLLPRWPLDQPPPSNFPQALVNMRLMAAEVSGLASTLATQYVGILSQLLTLATNPNIKTWQDMVRQTYCTHMAV
jgi:hypothetical protein